MKKVTQKIKSFIPKTTKYFFDFFVVFIGVFLAFWLNARKEDQNRQEEQIQVYRAIYEDMNAFYISGREENKEGFINFFQNAKNELDSLIAIKEIPPIRRFVGDYWHLEIINSLTKSDRLTNMDSKLFKGIGEINTAHQMFLDEIESYNSKYETYITANYEVGMEYFYKADSNELKERNKILLYRLNRIIYLAKMLVDNAKTIKYALNQEFNFEG